MSVDYYKKALKREQQKTKYAWGQYFQMRNEIFENQQNIYQNSELTEVSDELGTHLKKFISELYEKSKTYVECSICMDVITSETLDTTPCGHNFHKECMSNLKNHWKGLGTKSVPCPNCRKDLYIK